MANLRTGIYGNYYGSFFDESETLNASEMQTNAEYIYSSLLGSGWSENAIAAILGNMQAESSINPGRWQSDNVGNSGSGYGLVQWTPSTNYTDWCNEQGFSDPSEMDNNLARILFEVANGLQWIVTSSYNISFKDFTTSTESVSYLAKAFLLNYERPADQSESKQNYRAELASNWFTYITGTEPSDPSDNPNYQTSKRKKYNFLLFTSRRRRNQWTKMHF